MKYILTAREDQKSNKESLNFDFSLGEVRISSLSSEFDHLTDIAHTNQVNQRLEDFF